MLVLGLGTEGDSGAAIVEDGRILAAVNEERICRWKLVEGFPRDSIREVLRLSGATVSDLDAVLIAGEDDLLVEELHPFHGWFAHWGHSGGFGARVKQAAGKLSRFGKRLPILQKAYYAALTPSFWKRRRGLRRILREEFDTTCPVVFVDHHFSHVASTYFTSGFGDALVVSLDGGGDGKSGLIYAVRGGRFERLAEISAYHSLGNYYAYITHLCGFQAQKHEGKITGLAAHGEPRYLDLIREFVDERDGRTVNHAGRVFREAIRELERRLPEGWTREDLAASIQVHFERTVCKLVSYWADRTGLRDVAVAGGVFANVRVNEEVFRLPQVDRIFVHPGMTDGGLPVGGALSACAPGILERPMPWTREPLAHVYLGTELSEMAIAAALREVGLAPEPADGPLEARVADLLAQGFVVARADGRMEYGPRALGNRSILYQPTDPSVNDWLNENLDRTEFMPFAPAVMWEERHRCFEDVEGAAHTAEFMTITFSCTPWMREAMPGVVHVDGTARPQFVRQEVNPGFHAILREFHKRTGLPGVINTSFNMHEEPIVRTAEDCVRAFLRGRLDYLAIGSHLVRHPEAPEAGRPARERADRRLSVAGASLDGRPSDGKHSPAGTRGAAESGVRPA